MIADSSAATQDNVLSLDVFRNRNSEIASTATKDDPQDYKRFAWHDAITKRLSWLLSLPEGWDSYGAPALSHHIALFTKQILCDMWRPGLPLPDITPMSDGSLVLEWFTKTRELTIEINEPYRLTFEIVADGESMEGEITRGVDRLRQLADELIESNNPLKLSNG